MPGPEQQANDASNIKTLLRSVGSSRRQQVIIAVICFLLPLLCALPLVRRQDVAWQNSGLQGIPIEELAASQSVLYAASDEGIFRSDDGERWQPINAGLPVALWRGINVRALAADPRDPARAYALVSDSGDTLELYRTTNAGGNWEKMTLPPDPNILDALTIATGESNVLYLLSSRYIYQSTNGGQNWVRQGTVPRGIQPQTLAIDTQSLDTLYLGTLDRGVYHSDDGGRTWQARNSGLDSQTVRQLLINPVDRRVVFALTERGIYRSVDTGKNWNFVGQDLDADEITIMAAHPSRVGVVYVGTTEGQVLITADAGETWIRLGTRLGDASVLALVLDEKRVRVATNSGLWQFDLDLPPDLTPPSTVVALAPTPTSTATARPSATPVPTAFSTATPTATLAPTATNTPSPPAIATRLPPPTASPPPTPTASATPIPPPTATATSRPTIGPPTDTPTPTPVPPPTAKPSLTPTPTITPGGPRPTAPEETPPPSPTPTAASTPTSTATATPMPTSTPPATEPPTATSAPTATSTPPATSAPTPTATSTPPATSAPTPTATPAPTDTPVPTSTTAPTDTPAPTTPPVGTATPTIRPTPIQIPTTNPIPTIIPGPTPILGELRESRISLENVRAEKGARRWARNPTVQMASHLIGRGEEIRSDLDIFGGFTFNTTRSTVRRSMQPRNRRSSNA